MRTRFFRSIAIAVCLMGGVGSVNQLTAVEAKKPGSTVLGATGFLPTPEHPVSWRGDGTGCYPGATPPTKWSRTCVGGKPDSSGILWMTPIPPGGSSPIVVGDRVYFGFDPYGLICLSKTDGHLLWYRTHNYYEVMPDDKRKAIDDKAKPIYAKFTNHLETELKRMSDAVSPAGVPDDKRFMNWGWGNTMTDLQKQLDAVDAEAGYKADKNYWEWASATPASDGKYVYMWYSNRVAVCYDLDGNRQWATIDPANDQRFGEHGRHSSPVLAAGKFIVQYANDIIAFDCRTGKPLWTKTMAKTLPWAPPAYASIVPTVVGGAPYVVTCRGESFRVADGEMGWGPFKDYGGENTSAIVDGNRIFLWDRAGLIQMQIPAAPGPNAQAAVGKSVRGGKYYMVASPLAVNGLVYFVGDKGPLRVFDPEAGAVLYEKELPLNAHVEYVFFPGYSASPALAGKYIYIMDNQGGTVILEPGNAYKEVAVNKIETMEKKDKNVVVNEQTVCNPVFDGKLMFVRGQQYLYCIGSR